MTHTDRIEHERLRIAALSVKDLLKESSVYAELHSQGIWDPEVSAILQKELERRRAVPAAIFDLWPPADIG